MFGIGAYLRIYLNGVLDGTTTTGSGPGAGTSSVKIGRNSGGSYFNGLIDEVRVSNAAVYTGNFTPQMHLSATGSTKGLWKFDGESAADSSTNGNNGSLQGGATYSGDVPSGDGGGGLSGGSVSQVQWLVTDHLGMPRMIFDTTGALSNMKRHDYLPFGGGWSRPPAAAPRLSAIPAATEYASSSPQKNGMLRRNWTTLERDTTQRLRGVSLAGVHR